MVSDITVVITTIPVRSDKLQRALESVDNQIVKPDNIIVACDNDRLGAGPNRNKGLFQSNTKWTAFLDDDDVLYPSHLALLHEAVDHFGADLAYPWFDVIGGRDPLAVPVKGYLRSPLGVEFGDEQREYILTRGNFIPITYLVDTELAQSVGGYPDINTPEWPMDNCEDWGFLQKLAKIDDTKFYHVPEKTWAWYHWGGNTSGKNNRW